MIFKRIEEKIDKIIKSQNEENKIRSKWEEIKEKYLFETLDAKGKLETGNAKLLKENSNLKDALNTKEKLIEECEKSINDYKNIIKDLTSEINTLVKYKNKSLEEEYFLKTADFERGENHENN